MGCVAPMFFLDVTCCDMEEWLLDSDAVCYALTLSCAPDYATLQCTCHKLNMLSFAPNEAAIP